MSVKEHETSQLCYLKLLRLNRQFVLNMPVGVLGAPPPPQIIANQLILSQPEGRGRLCPSHSYLPPLQHPGFSDPPTALLKYVGAIRAYASCQQISRCQSSAQFDVHLRFTNGSRQNLGNCSSNTTQQIISREIEQQMLTEMVNIFCGQ